MGSLPQFMIGCLKQSSNTKPYGFYEIAGIINNDITSPQNTSVHFIGSNITFREALKRTWERQSSTNRVKNYLVFQPTGTVAPNYNYPCPDGWTKNGTKCVPPTSDDPIPANYGLKPTCNQEMTFTTQEAKETFNKTDETGCRVEGKKSLFFEEPQGNAWAVQDLTGNFRISLQPPGNTGQCSTDFSFTVYVVPTNADKCVNNEGRAMGMGFGNVNTDGSDGSGASPQCFRSGLMEYLTEENEECVRTSEVRSKRLIATRQNQLSYTTVTVPSPCPSGGTGGGGSSPSSGPSVADLRNQENDLQIAINAQRQFYNLADKLEARTYRQQNDMVKESQTQATVTKSIMLQNEANQIMRTRLWTLLWIGLALGISFLVYTSYKSAMQTF